MRCCDRRGKPRRVPRLVGTGAAARDCRPGNVTALHNVLIGLHAAAGMLAFGVGATALFQSGPRSWRYPAYFGCLHRPRNGWRHKYIDDIGFTLISLFDGFVIVAAIDLNAPVWAIVLIAILGVVVGNWGIGRVKARLPASKHPDAAAR